MCMLFMCTLTFFTKSALISSLSSPNLNFARIIIRPRNFIQYCLDLLFARRITEVHSMPRKPWFLNGPCHFSYLLPGWLLSPNLRLNFSLHDYKKETTIKQPRVHGHDKTYHFEILCTTLNSVMTTKPNLQRFWPCHNKGFIKISAMIPKILACSSGHLLTLD